MKANSLLFISERGRAVVPTRTKTACPICAYLMLASLCFSVTAYGQEGQSNPSSTIDASAEKGVAEDKAAELKRGIAGYREAHHEILNNLKKAQKNIHELLWYWRKLNALEREKRAKPKHAAALEKKKDALRRKYQPKFDIDPGTIGLQNKAGQYVTNARKVQRGIRRAIAKYEKTSPEYCFPNESDYAATAQCEELKHTYSDRFKLGIAEGRIYYNRLNESFEIVKHYLEDTELFDKTDPSLSRDAGYFYLSLALLNEEQECRKIYAYPENNPFDNLQAGISTFRKGCIIDRPDEDLYRNLYLLKDAYPEDSFIRANLKKYETWVHQCDWAAHHFCHDVHVHDDTAIMSYRAARCEIRDVTADDLNNGMARMATTAEELTYSRLKEHLTFCQEAYDAGFRWSYVKPKPRPSCNDRKKPVKKKKTTY